jgi:hypothetical protein
VGASLLDEDDEGNFVTVNGTGAGISGCTFADCTGDHALSEIFVQPDAGDFHLAGRSPAIDRGTNGYARDGKDWVPGVDIDGDVPPLDGDGDGVDLVDVGCDEGPGAATENTPSES